MKKILIILLSIITSSCTMPGEHFFKGEQVFIAWGGDVPVFLSRDTTQKKAIELCKERFGSESVTWKPGTCGVLNDGVAWAERCSHRIRAASWDAYICNAPIAKTNYSNEEKETIDTKLNTAKQKCKDRNFTEGTQEFGECVLKLSE